MPRAVRLTWDGKDRPSPEEAAPPRRSWATEDGHGWLLEGDNLRVLRGLAATHAGQVSLAYLDPPFFTNREHSAMLRKAGKPRTDRTRVLAFDDRWADLASYLHALGARLEACLLYTSDAADE